MRASRGVSRLVASGFRSLSTRSSASSASAWWRSVEGVEGWEGLWEEVTDEDEPADEWKEGGEEEEDDDGGSDVPIGA